MSAPRSTSDQSDRPTPPTIVIAPDSFKGSLLSVDLAGAVRRGVERTLPDADCVEVPMADGGEGTVDAVLAVRAGQRVETVVRGPNGAEVTAHYALLSGGDGPVTAIIEMAAASGLDKVAPHARDPLSASTWGTGQLVADALGRGAERIVLGAGGSATIDGGVGMAQALGARFLTAADEDVGPGGGVLEGLDHIDLSGLHPRIADVEVLVASDVASPLLGQTGAATVFGPQKGAQPGDVDVLEAGLDRLARVARDHGITTDPQAPGAGAAGGLGFGARAFLGASIVSGVEWLAQVVGLADRVAGADLVITGEGHMDGQTRQGKTPLGVARIAAAAGVPVVALVGGHGDVDDLLDDGTFAAVVPVVPGPIPLDEALRRAEELVTAAARMVAGVWWAGRTGTSRFTPAES